MYNYFTTRLISRVSNVPQFQYRQYYDTRFVRECTIIFILVVKFILYQDGKTAEFKIRTNKTCYSVSVTF